MKVINYIYCYIFINHRKIIKFLISGVIATGISLILLYVLTEFFHFWYLASAIIAYITAMTLSFIMQKLWTFRDKDMTRIPFQATSHVVLAVSGLSFNAVSLYILVEFFNLWYMIAQVIIALIIALVNFIVYKYYIFNQV